MRMQILQRCDQCNAECDYGLSVCEFPPVGEPSCMRSLCRDCAKFYGPQYLCACPEHAATIQEYAKAVLDFSGDA